MYFVLILPEYYYMKFTTNKQIRKILGGAVEVTHCPYPTFLVRRQDDTDGSKETEHNIIICMGSDGDMHIGVGDSRMIRFRNWGGGGYSLHTHNALRILQEAILMDMEERPQDGITPIKTK